MSAAPISLMPHAVCWAAAPRLIWTMVITNLVTFLSYLTICITLLILVRRTRRIIAREWAFFVVGFALFIVACGSTHLLEVITTWIPVFWIDASTNIVTAALSAYVALQLIRRSSVIGFSLNDYSDRLGNAENEKRSLEASVLASQKLDDWSRMSAGVAHEIAQPLDAVHNLLYLIRTQEGILPEIARLAALADEETSRIVTLSRSTLSFFRQSEVPESTDLLAAAESVRLVLARKLGERNVDLQIVSTGDPTVEAFAGEPRQILLNLVRNACEASPEGGSRISATFTGLRDSVRLVVSDQGSGMPPAILANLFQFGTSTKGESGNGMGLWTVKHILDRHHATIAVDSAPGQGTTFTIEWPRTFIADQPQAEQQEEAVFTAHA